MEFLDSASSKNIMLSTAIVQAMMTYEMVDPPIASDVAATGIESILRSPDCDLTHQLAYVAVTNIFEEYYQGAYYEAIEALVKHDRVRLFTKAALGTPEYSMSVDWILEKLLKLGDPTSLPAFVRWFQIPDRKSSSPQDSSSCYVLAIKGCAMFLEAPLLPTGAEACDELAWAIYGAILFWLYKPDISDERRREACAPLWERLFAEARFEAIDPLIWFEQASRMRDRGRHAVKDLCDASPQETRRILEFGLKNCDRLTGLFPRTPFDDSRASFAVRWLGVVGDRNTARILEPHVNSPDLGRVVVEALRRAK